MRFLKNKFFISALIAALLVATSATVLSVMGIKSPLRSIFGTLASPFRWVFSQAAEGMAGFSAYFTEFDRLAEENAGLRSEVESLRLELDKARQAKEENEFLRGVVGLENLRPEWRLREATVIGRESGSYMTVYTLNRGSLHGVSRGMPVITESGVVGYVREVGLAWCKVVPITETSSTLGGYVGRSGAAGIVSGDYTLRKDGLCRMSYIPDGADIQEGDIVITSGTGTIYPAGLVIGTVSALVADGFSRTYNATITPAVDYDGITRVLIIISYTVSGGASQGDTTSAEASP